MQSITNQQLLIKGPSGNIEALETRVSQSRPIIAIICHPHPLHPGSSMQNKVVTMLAKTMSALNINSIRFNFRGVGNSDGVHDHGVGEIDDCLAVCAFAKQTYPHAAFWLMGFSFGSYIAAIASTRWPTEQLISIAPAVTHAPYDDLKVTCPWLVIAAEQDEIVPYADTKAWAERPAAPLTFLTIKGSSHFFHGKLIELKELLIAQLC